MLSNTVCVTCVVSSRLSSQASERTSCSSSGGLSFSRREISLNSDSTPSPLSERGFTCSPPVTSWYLDATPLPSTAFTDT